jgi:hypothetical protein
MYTLCSDRVSLDAVGLQWEYCGTAVDWEWPGDAVGLTKNLQSSHPKPLEKHWKASIESMEKHGKACWEGMNL